MVGSAVEPKRVTTTEAATLLGVATSTLWAYVNAGLLVPNAPHGRGPGKRVYFDRAEVEAFAKKGAAGAAAYRQRRDAE